MAHLRDITRECQRSLCTSKATVRLYSWQNSEMGMYCRKHGAEALKTQQAYEDREHGTSR